MANAGIGKHGGGGRGQGLVAAAGAPWGGWRGGVGKSQKGAAGRWAWWAARCRPIGGEDGMAPVAKRFESVKLARLAESVKLVRVGRVPP